MTSELQVVGKAASTAIQTWMRNNDKTKARAEEREKYIGWIKRLFTAWRVSHDERNERRAEREEAGEEDSEEDETPVVIPSSAVTTRRAMSQRMKQQERERGREWEEREVA